MKKILILIFLLSSCNAPKDTRWDSVQKKLSQEKVFNIKEDKIRKAFKSVLIKDGYQITSSNSELLTATSPTWDSDIYNKKRRNSFFMSLGMTTSSTTAASVVNHNYNNVNTFVVASAPSSISRDKIGVKYSISVNFEKEKKDTKVILTIFESELYTSGSENTQELQDKRFYKLIYDKVNYELYKG